MKECSGKKVLKVKVAQNDPLDSPSQKKMDQVDSKIKDVGQSYMFKKKFISKKVLIVKVAQNGPLDSSSQKIDQVDSEINDMR